MISQNIGINPMSKPNAPDTTTPDAGAPTRPFTPEEKGRLDRKVGEEARRQAEVGQTVRGNGG